MNVKEQQVEIKYLKVLWFPRQQHRDGVVASTEGAQRDAGNEVPIWWSLLRPPLLPAPDAAPNQKKIITAVTTTIERFRIIPLCPGKKMASSWKGN